MLDIIPTHRYRFPITRCPVCAKSHALLSYGHSGPILTAFYSNLPTRDGFIHALANTVAVYKYQCSQHRSVTYVVVSLIRKINPAKKIVFFVSEGFHAMVSPKWGGGPTSVVASKLKWHPLT